MGFVAEGLFLPDGAVAYLAPSATNRFFCCGAHGADVPSGGGDPGRGPLRSSLLALDV